MRSAPRGRRCVCEGSRHDMAVISTAVTLPQSGEIALGRRLRDWRTLAGFAVSAGIVGFFILTAHLDLATVWARVQTADLRYLALALAVYFGTFLFRGLR